MDEPTPTGVAGIPQDSLRSATPSDFANLENPEGLPQSLVSKGAPTLALSPAATLPIERVNVWQVKTLHAFNLYLFSSASGICDG